MPRPLCHALCALLLAGTALTIPAAAGQPSQKAPAPAAGRRDLDLGREAVSRQDYAAAIPALRRAVAALDPQRDRAAFADAWLQLGMAYLLSPGGDPEQALAAFLASAAAAPNPASAYLWADTAAERLGRRDEAEIFKARALGGPPAPPEPIPAPAPPVPEQERGAGKAKAAEPEPAASGAAFDHFFRRRRAASSDAREEASSPTGEEQPPPAETKPDAEKPPAS